MKPLQIRSLKASYNPGYPRFTEVPDWERLIRPSSERLFHPATLLFAGLLGSSLLVPAQAADLPGGDLKTSNSEAGKIARETLSGLSDSWFKNSEITRETDPTTGNPALTLPQIRISFGNSFMGVFDTSRAKKATVALFAAYGVNLTPDYAYKKDGVEFTVDGYDPEKKIGFEIVGDDPPNFAEPLEPPPKIDLDPQEAETLKAKVKAGRETLFLAPVGKYPNMDGDQYTPTRAYLQSVLDYLEWLKAEGRL